MITAGPVPGQECPMRSFHHLGPVVPVGDRFLVEVAEGPRGRLRSLNESVESLDLRIVEDSNGLDLGGRRHPLSSGSRWGRFPASRRC